MYTIAAVVLIWLATSLVIGAGWAVATYRRPAPVDHQPVPPIPDLPRPRARTQSPARTREHAGSR